MHIYQELNETFPVRNKKDQKQAFRAWLLQKAEEMGYAACAEATDKKGNTQNVIVGDVEKAKVIFTAHYDTPRRAIMPNLMMPRSPFVSVLYALLLVIPLLFVSLYARYLVDEYLGLPELGLLVYLVVYFGVFYFLMLGGKVNPNNANDNTSGCAVLLKMMADMPEEQREKAAFIFFDNEEKGMVGSSGFAKKHPVIKKETLVINMDCVAYGDQVLAIGKKKAMEDEKYDVLLDALPENAKYNVHFFSSKGSMMNSDHSRFDKGIGVCACKKAPVVGFACGRIHTPRDTEADTENVDYLSGWMNNFVENIKA